MLKRYIKFINENSIAFDDDIKNELRKLYKGSVYDKTNGIDDRIEILFRIHKPWLNMVKKQYSAERIAKDLYTYEKNLKENLEYSDIENIINKDINVLRLEEPLVIHKAKELLNKIITTDEEKYYNIIDILKIQNEVNDYIGRLQKPKYTNLEYLSKKSHGATSVIKTKWEEIKQNVFKNEK